ncbi:ABC-F type ribosomal protection protein [Herbivorax sp. ANBcel31]|uniref:ribosomal protection-like ABC-F family protein n=1 Tax=Herbivorax sp. ANBcel31 TaxID=3069754 RepID=UPI0027B51DFB|nr:ABC-F type ribosomal protection protein [Herbivorax sp. ANBcel31]MDQ2086768.1 ABC-F type ribosomal protection protein [Herbivorax sp. ANBcel31]
MLLVECSGIKKYFGERLILKIDNLKIYSGDCIGVVGVNGVGKTTLIDILSQRLEPDEGLVKLHQKAGYISQLELPDNKNLSNEIASKFCVNTIWDETMSGGEKTKFKVAAALEEGNMIIFADEPTSNMDMESIKLLEEKFINYTGTLIVISHDRSFLDKLCNQILEIENGRIKMYKGNYTDYTGQKMQERTRAGFEYKEYINEKKRLEGVIHKVKQKGQNIKKAPKRMGNSEARLHKMGGQKQKAKLDKNFKNAKKRIEHLEVKEKPKEQRKIQLNILESNRSYSKVLLEGKNINKSFYNKIIFKNADFVIENGAKIALIGSNGCGKSTLIKMIMENENGIKISQSTKIGYFSQSLNILKSNLSIIENVMENSIYSENFARLLLAKLLFKGESVYKKVNVLSGGELVKVSFARILLEDINMLILDEPTNYLDISSLEVIEEALREYDRTLLFVSHDRHFINVVADQIMTIENKKIKLFKGSYEEYLYKKSKPSNDNKEIGEQIIILKNRLSEVIGRLSSPSKDDDIEELDKEYQKILGELKRLKEE